MGNSVYDTSIKQDDGCTYLVPSAAYCWNISNWLNYGYDLTDEQWVIAQLMLHGY